MPTEAATAIPRVSNQQQLEVCNSVSFSAFRPDHHPIRQHHSSLPPSAGPLPVQPDGFHGSWGFKFRPLARHSSIPCLGGPWRPRTGGARLPRGTHPRICARTGHSLCFFPLLPLPLIPLPSCMARASFRPPLYSSWPVAVAWPSRLPVREGPSPEQTSLQTVCASAHEPCRDPGPRGSRG